MTTKQGIPINAGTFAGWTTIPIIESHEPLAPIIGSGLATYPVYTYRYNVAVDMLVRRSVLQRLLHAQKQLPDDTELVVLDAYRSIEFQRRLYDAFYVHIERQQPELDAAAVHTRTQKFVRLPSLSLDAPSPHLTGGAVDVRLRKKGKWLHAGSEHDEISDESALCFFEDDNNIRSSRDRDARNLRRLLYNAMVQAGFAGYEHEWWHFNAPETQMGAANLGLPDASFGPITEV